MDRGTHTTATALIDAVRERTRTARVAEAAAFVAVGDWADAHTSGAVVGDPIGALGEWLDPEHAETLAGDQFLELGGPGAPVVAEFCISEIAAVRGCSFDAARRLVGDAVELRHRLPRVHARVVAGEVEVWRGRRIAQQTRVLSFDGARFVDANVAYVAGRATSGDIDRLVAEAAARFDPESLEAERLDADAGRHVTIDFSGLAYRDPLTGTLRGTVDVTGSLDLADALDLERAVAHVAGQLADLGSTDDLDVRRSIALGEIARRSDGIDTLAFSVGEASSSEERPVLRSKRDVVLYVHLDHAAITGTVHGFGPGIDACTGTTGIDLAHLDTPGMPRGLVTADQVRSWCGSPDTRVVVKPVIDLTAAPTSTVATSTVATSTVATPTVATPTVATSGSVTSAVATSAALGAAGGSVAGSASISVARLAVDGYRPTERIADHVRLRWPRCVFPYCTRSARASDLDHRNAYDPTTACGMGQTSTTNLYPLCRRHHRMKTHPELATGRRWSYRPTDPEQGEPPGVLLWTSPTGLTYLVDRDGTRPWSRPAPDPDDPDDPDDHPRD
ncbi:MAG TPA: DUF222 domain-containing protein [Nocardioides sp.]